MADDTQVEPRLKTLKNGAVYDLDKGRIVANPGGGTQAITSDSARELLARRRAVGLRSQLRGLAKGIGLDPAEIDDELLAQSGDALEALTAHMAQTFKGSKSLRGMAEAYNTLASPLIGDKRERDASRGDGEPERPAIYVFIAQYMSKLIDVPESVLDGLVSEIDISESNTSRQAVRVGEQDDGNTDSSPTGQPKQDEAE